MTARTGDVPAAEFNASQAAINGKESDMDFTAITPGCIPTGTDTPLGVVEGSTLTAYRIGGEFVPFARVHGKPAAAEILVTFGGAW